MSACVTVGVGAYGFDVLDVFAARLEFPDLERAVQDQHLVWSARYPGVPFVVLVEDKGSGQSLIQAARRWPHANITIIPVPANRPNEKMQKVNEIAPTVEARRVRVPAQAHWLDAALHEWTSFPFARHDDRTDALAMAIARAAGITQHSRPASDASAFAPAEASRRDRTRRIRRGRR
jgi:predicted phage terminase large subunit-like protein